jgi:UDP-glucuronate 4-epimerase
MQRFLVTGAAGFIGFHLCRRLLQDGHAVVGIDNLNSYYDPALKRARLKQLEPFEAFTFHQLDLADRQAVPELFAQLAFDGVVNLAAQAGVRYSLQHPAAYIDSNLVGFANLLEACRHFPTQHLVYASSSSVYGANTKMPFATSDNVDHPISLYAATKKANELMAYTYSHLYGIPTTGLRFFTVYGPWGRPDMAYFLFTKAILEGKPIEVFNQGQAKRDFTYIDDIVEGVVRVMARPPKAAPTPYKLYNIGNNKPVELMTFIETLEALLGKTAKKHFLPSQPGDVPATYADIDALSNDTGFRPTTTIADGLRCFVEWYKAYYHVVSEV